MNHHCAITAPSPHHHRTIPAPSPSPHHHRTVTPPSLHHHCHRRGAGARDDLWTLKRGEPSPHHHCTITITLSPDYHCTIIVPGSLFSQNSALSDWYITASSLHHHCAITAPYCCVLNHHCTIMITVPSLTQGSAFYFNAKADSPAITCVLLLNKVLPPGFLQRTPGFLQIIPGFLEIIPGFQRSLRYHDIHMSGVLICLVLSHHCTITAPGLRRAERCGLGHLKRCARMYNTK